jgi:hypothetical protein
MSPFTTLRDRDAWNTIRGYVYQVDLTIERWLNLRHGQTLELERGEDIDIVSRSLTATPEEQQRLLEQVKHRVSSITLKSSEAVTAIACFIDHRQTNPTANLLFRFTTNTEVGKEKLSPMPNKAPAIVAWEQIRQGNLQGTAQNAALQGIRIILKNVKQPKKLHSDTWQIFCDFITNVSDERLLELICSFEWSTKAPEAKSLSPSLQKLLIDRKHARDNIEAQEQYRRLFLYVFKRLCEREKKQLTVKELSSQLSLPTLSETDHQLLNDLLVWFHALEVRVQEHEVRLGVLEQRLDREQAEPYIGQEVADCIDNLLRDYTKLFVGRETILKQLDEFLTEKRTNLLTLIAPAGFGKTALLANWVASRKDDGSFIVYHFFSQRYDVTRSFSAVYRNLLRQLYDYYEPSDRQIPNNEDGLRDKLYRLIKEYSERDGRPLVIVLDALDEAEPPFRQFLPLLPKNVFLIASARLARAEEGQEPEYLRGWTDNALPICLDRLPKPPDPAIANWLRQTGEGELAAFAEDIQFVAQLDEITQGFPLYLSYLTDELSRAAKQGQDVREVLEQTPKGFERYVGQQLRRLDELDLPDERWQFFALLAVAKGALEQEDVKALTGMRDRQLRQLHLCWQVTRWMRISQGKLYAFAHPLLATTFAEKLEGDAKDALQDLIDYCAKWQEHQSRYALRHYAEHLREVKRWEELYAIARNKDFAVAQWEQLPDEPDLPLKTVQTALLGAAQRDDAGAMAKLMLVHAHRLGQTNAQESPLEALRSGSLERAWKLADMYEIERRTLWYLLLAWELKDKGKLKEAQETLKRLQHKQLPCLSNHPATDWQSDYAAYFLAHVFEVSEHTCAALGQQLLDDCYHRSLCRILSDRGYFTAAIETALSISWDLMPVLELEYIAKAQAKKGDREAARATFAKALEITRKLLPNSLWVMEEIAQAQIEVADREAARATFAETIDIAKKIPYPSQVKAFVAIADKQAAVGEFNDALYTLQGIDDISNLENSLKALVLRATAKAEAKAGNKDKARVTFASAIEIAHGIEDKEKQADVLIEIARAQAEVGEFADARATAKTIECRWKQGFALEDITTRQAYVREFSHAIETATEIKCQLHQPLALQAVACQQAKAEDFPAALATAHRIEELMWKAQALKTIAIRQAESSPFTDDALKIALEIEDESEQTQALVGIVKAQAEVGNFHAALKTNNRIKDASGQQDAFAAIAEAYAKAKNFDDAFEAAEMIESQPMRVRTLGAIAKIQAEASQLPEARATFATVLKTEPEPKPEISFLKARTLVQVAEVQLKNEQKKVGADTASIAHKIAQSIAHPTQQAIALALTADILIKAGNIKEAKAICESAFEIAQKISKKKEHERSNSFKLIAQAQARAMEFDAAIETALMIKIGLFFAEALSIITQLQIGADAQQIERWKTILTDAHKFYENEQHLLDLSNKVEVLSIIAVARVAAGDKETGLATLTQLYEAAQAKKSRERDKNLYTIAAAQAEAEDIPTALKITDEIEDGWEQVRALCKIAWEQLNTGKKEKLQTTLTAALKARDKIQDEHKRVKALRKIAQIQAMQAKAEVREQAVRTTELMLIERNNLLGSIASILAEVKDKQNFKKLLISCAYYLDIAYEMCGYLARLYPEKAEEVAKVVSELN